MPPRPARTVAEEIGQTKPFASVGQEVMVALLRTADDVRWYVTAHLEGEGITLQQYNVLRILRGAGADGLPTLDVARRMIERQPGVTRLVDRLIRKGLVQRHRGTEDRRQVLCTLTPEGAALLARLDPVVNQADEVLDTTLAAQELRALLELLGQMRAALANGG